MAKTAKSKKAKGMRLEKLVASTLRSSGLDKRAKRMPMSGAITGFKSDVYTKLPISIECKNSETWQPVQYMKQAAQDADINHKMPVVIMSKNRLPDPFVMMKMSDWIQIMVRAFKENDMPIAVGKNAYSKHTQLKKG